MLQKSGKDFERISGYELLRLRKDLKYNQQVTYPRSESESDSRMLSDELSLSDPALPSRIVSELPSRMVSEGLSRISSEVMSRMPPESLLRFFSKDPSRRLPGLLSGSVSEELSRRLAESVSRIEPESLSLRDSASAGFLIGTDHFDMTKLRKTF